MAFFKMTNTKSLLSVLFATFALAACGTNGGGGVASTGPGVGQTGTGVDIRTCQVGQIYSQQYGCLNRGQCGTNQGIVLNTNQCVPGQLVTEESIHGVQASTRLYSAITISNRTQLELLLKNAGLCDFGAYGWGVTIGQANCGYLASRGAFVIVRLFTGSANDVSVTVGAGTQYPTDLLQVPGIYSQQFINGYQYGYPQYPLMGATYQRYSAFSQQSRTFDYNNSQGIQIVGFNYAGQDVGMRIVVENGRFGSNNLMGRLLYQNVEVGTITLQRY